VGNQKRTGVPASKGFGPIRKVQAAFGFLGPMAGKTAFFQNRANLSIKIDFFGFLAWDLKKEKE
jgi:hypothetical protein